MEISVATDDVAARLGVDPGTQLISRHQQADSSTTHRGRCRRRSIPWTSSHGARPTFSRRKTFRLGAVQYIEETLGLKQTGYRDWITVRAPDANETMFFRIPGDGRVPVLEVFRTAFDQELKPMRLTVTVFPADRNQFILEVGSVPAP